MPSPVVPSASSPSRPASCEEVDERRERVLVERATAVPKRRGRGGERALDHRPLAEKCW